MKLKTPFLAMVSAALVMLVTSSLSQGQDPSRSGKSPRHRGHGQGHARGWGGGPPGGRDPVVGLLRNEQVREELKITDEQDKAIKQLVKASRPERPELPKGAKIRDMNEEDRRAFFEKMRATQKKRIEEMKLQLEEVLLPQQMKRMKEIVLQIQGVRALSNQDVIEQLGISSEQEEQFQEMRESVQGEMRGKIRELFAGGGAREGMREKMMELRKEMENQVLDVLTSDQKSQFEEMKGELFEMPPRDGKRQGRRENHQP